MKDKAFKTFSNFQILKFPNSFRFTQKENRHNKLKRFLPVCLFTKSVSVINLS